MADVACMTASFMVFVLVEIRLEKSLIFCELDGMSVVVVAAVQALSMALARMSWCFSSALAMPSTVRCGGGIILW